MLPPPVAVVSEQLSVPSDTVTVPVITGAPAVFVTLTLTVYDWPTVDGSGVSEVIVVVVVLRGVTTCAAVPELVANAALPAYVAVSVFEPWLVDVNAHE